MTARPEILSHCQACVRTYGGWPGTPKIVSPTGTAHIPRSGVTTRTLCGRRVPDGWWRPW